ncbi:hypothetical protein SmJEL517_g02770 [Synchytrium microbalum]|uniref:Sec1-like protein n=1 Tax=Synchytrium microbalum TaxID=1806994 RepID=A0A507CB34_9FUNG|nr:uncharacterized protein SmJEL517_g02770 [Synchytrium microbalum]TPX34745.1 hypothetical protein SmJEL517_g02770 [Synchytrium microbalum]
MNFREASQRAWDLLRLSLPGSVLLVDQPSLQCLKWSLPGGITSIFESGAMSSLPSRVVIITSQHVAKCHVEIKEFILSHRFTDVKLFVTLSEDAHLQELATDPSLSIGPFGGASTTQPGGLSSRWWSHVESVLADWMSESAARHDPNFAGDYMVSIEHLPLTWSLLSDYVVLFPGSSLLFPALPSTSTRAENQPGFQADIQQLGTSLMTFLDVSHLRDEIFAIGETSRQLGRFIVSRSAASPRRDSGNGIAVILFDRTLDLVSPTMHSDNILDQAYSLLPRVTSGSVDLSINPEALCGDGANSLGRASIAHGMDPDSVALISALVMVGQRDGLVAVRKRLVDLIGKVVPDVKLPKKLLSSFVGNERAFYRYGNLLQILSAAVESFQECANSKWDELVSIEKTIALSLSETGDAVSTFHQLIELIPTPGRPSVFTIRDVLCLTTYIYALLGSTIDIPEDEELVLISTFIKALIPASATAADDDDARLVRMDIETWVTNAFRTLRTMASARSNLHTPSYRHVLKSKSPIPYVSLLKQVVMDVLPGVGGAAADPFGSEGSSRASAVSEVEDLPHIPYGGTLGNVFSGFRRLVGGGRPHPSQYKKIFVFVSGGMTFSEARELRELGRERDVEILIGSPNVATSSVVFHQLLPRLPDDLKLA